MIQYPVEVDGVLTRVLAAGSGDDHLVLVHGVGARCDRWSRNIDALAAEGWNVHALDLPGHGLAQKGKGPDYSVPGCARFVDGFLDLIGAETAVLVGTSLGGHTVATLACDRPRRVRALVLVGSIGLIPWGAERRAATRGRLRDASRESIENKLRLLVSRPGPGHRRVASGGVPDQQLARCRRVLPRDLPTTSRIFIDDDVVGPRLASLEGRPPVQLIWGEEERAVPLETGVAAHELLAGSELAVIAAASHAPYFERPEEFNQVLLDFLDRTVRR